MTGFTFLESYYTTISDGENGLSEDEKARLYKAIIEYVFADVMPEFKGILRVVFSVLLPSLDKSKTRSKAKQNKIKSKTKSNQKEMKIKTKESFDFQREKEPPQEKERSKEKDILLYPPQEKEKNKSLSIKGQAAFFEEFPQIVMDNYDSSVLAELSDDDWETIAEQFRKSDWLKKNVKTLSTLCRLSARIIAGQYAPFEKEQSEQEELSEDERRENAAWYEKTFGNGE